MTKCCLSVRLKEHATQVTNSAIGKHYSNDKVYFGYNSVARKRGKNS